MAKQLSIEETTGDPAIDIALDTIALGKQALCFVNTKRSAEATAEKIGKKNGEQGKLTLLADQILNAIPKPTRQCHRLAFCVGRGTAFHHAGLTAKQRHIVEDAFIKGDIKIICATPTLAAGVNVPAFRTIIRDLKRFTGAGMSDIPVLEYLQMAGRSGRPDFNDEYGEAIAIAKTDAQAENITDTYVFGEPESIWSKVSSLPVLRTYCLSLVATEFVNSTDSLKEFFDQTFFAHQYGDTKGIHNKIDETLHLLTEWGFVQMQSDDFTSASELGAGKVQATKLGKRVSELYLDPLTAHHILSGMDRSKGINPNFMSWMQLLSHTREMRPIIRLKQADYEKMQALVEEEKWMTQEPTIYDPEYEDWLSSIKTASLFTDWASETDEETLLESYGVRPGELRAKIEVADWLIYATTELARLTKQQQHVSPLYKIRTRLKYGAREELIPLLRYKNIGRVRARKLFSNKIRTAKDIKERDYGQLSVLIGKKTAADLKKQVGEDAPEVISPRARKGQMSLQKT